MGRVFMVELDGKAYRCRCCDSPLALADDVLSRSFSCRKGRAYLFENALTSTKYLFKRPEMVPVKLLILSPIQAKNMNMDTLLVNVSVGPEEDRLMMSGMHTVADIFCCSCGQLLGWKYMVARDKNQKFKEGKVVLERWRITEDSNEAFSLDTRQNSSDTEYP
ncbi:hypothetical protein Cgig2_026436 [Carnegiea gigantea]|uniref:Protein yippee-like n=1 Tax=Carnegiea gigantea TaxID=171969 RepID=A0A9Q1QLC2_9CARY|nr:hypothetical protein Cgig2_026436 [Carnegiea gigantea]